MKKGVDYTGITVCFICHDGHGNFLYALRNKNCRDEHGRWDHGAGGLEFGEAVTSTLEKEILEEYCTDVLSFEFLGYRDVHRTHDGKPTHWIALDFAVLVNRDKVAIGEPHKFDAIDWFTLDALPSPIHSQEPEFQRLYRDRLLAL